MLVDDPLLFLIDPLQPFPLLQLPMELLFLLLQQLFALFLRSLNVIQAFLLKFELLGCFQQLLVELNNFFLQLLSLFFHLVFLGFRLIQVFLLLLVIALFPLVADFYLLDVLAEGVDSFGDLPLGCLDLVNLVHAKLVLVLQRSLLGHQLILNLHLFLCLFLQLRLLVVPPHLNFLDALG